MKEQKQRLYTRLLDLNLMEEEKRLNRERWKERCETKQHVEYIVFKEKFMRGQKAKVED